jgi:hypothetical protein
MNIRQLLNSSPVLTGLAALVVAGTAVAFAARSLGTHPPDTSHAFFTTDDGKTWFSDSSNNIPPFEKDGKTAYRCSVYECNGKQFVLEMQRYDEKSAQALRDAQVAARTQSTDPKKRAPGPNPQFGLQVKAPGDAKWHSAMDVAAMNKMSEAIKCGSGYATNVEP